MGAPVGNQNAVKGKRWADSIAYVLAEAEREDRPWKLREIARVLLAKAAEGDMAAIKEVGDRLDGKAPQAIVGDSSAPLVVQLLRQDESA